jgi:preprotein translocase subunit SecE
LARRGAFDIREAWRAAERSRAAFLFATRPAKSPRKGSRDGRNGTIMENPFNFLQEVRVESRKVTWPTRRETLVTTGVVILMVFATALFFLSVDQIIRLLVGLILGLGH